MRLLIALLLATALSGCSDESPAPAAAPTVTVTTTSTPSAAPRPALRFSGKPRLPYVAGHTLHHPDGRTLSLPADRGYTAITSYAGGYLVSDDRVFEGSVGMARLDAEGRRLDQWTGTGAPLVSRDGRVAWISLVVAESGRTGPTVLHTDSVDGGAEVTQEIDRTLMPFLTGWFRGQLVYETWGRSFSFLTDLRSAPRPIPKAEDLGMLSPDGVYTARTTHEGVEIRMADGQLVDTVSDRGLTRTLGGLAWEDERHVLATLTRGQRQCVLRIGDDGRTTRATAWRHADSAGFAFLVDP